MKKIDVFSSHTDFFKIDEKLMKTFSHTHYCIVYKYPPIPKSEASVWRVIDALSAMKNCCW